VGAALVPDYLGEVVMARQERDRDEIRAAAESTFERWWTITRKNNIDSKQGWCFSGW